MNNNDLTRGNITRKLATLAFPIMGTSFLQMAYNLIDMVWIGRLGAGAVASVGTAGYFLWLSFSLIALSRTGAEVKVAQSLGSGKPEEANTYNATALTFGVVLGVLYGLSLILFRQHLIGFFGLNDSIVEGNAQMYLVIVSFSMPFSLFNQIISAVYNASGQSRLPFRANAMGLLVNIVMDPLLIFGAGLGVMGAAIATVGAQMFVSVLLLRMVFSGNQPYSGFHLYPGRDLAKLREMLGIAIPVALQNGLFTVISMFVARIVASHGTTAIAVQRVGTQVEAISYMTAHGFSVALSAMVGQNLGAGKMNRVNRSFSSALAIMGLFGVFTSMALYFGAEPIFRVFIDEQPALSMGAVYLRIISISQFFMCIEITMAGGFNGMGRSVPPALISVGFNMLRIPAAFLLSTYTVLGLNGIWWAISMSSVFKGTVLFAVLLIVLRKLSHNQLEEAV